MRLSSIVTSTTRMSSTSALLQDQGRCHHETTRTSDPTHIGPRSNIAECHISDRKFLRRKAFEKLKNRINSRDRKRANHRSAANEQPSRCHCRNRSGPQSAKESLAGALGFCPERQRIVLGPFHVGPYGFRVDDPDQQRCHVVGDQDVRGTVYPRQSLFRHRGCSRRPGFVSVRAPWLARHAKISCELSRIQKFRQPPANAAP